MGVGPSAVVLLEVDDVMLYVIAGLIVTSRLAAYWFSDVLATRIMRARPLTSIPELDATVAELASAAVIPMPGLCVISSRHPRAFVAGRNPGHSEIALSQGLLFELTAVEVKGVLAHEVAHIRNRDARVSAIAAVITVAAALAAVQSAQLLLSRDGPAALLMAAAVVMSAMAVPVLRLAVARRREYLADATAAGLLGCAAPLADGLARLTVAPARQPVASAPRFAKVRGAHIQACAWLTCVCSTHPPVSARIRRLTRPAGTAAGAEELSPWVR